MFETPPSAPRNTTTREKRNRTTLTTHRFVPNRKCFSIFSLAVRAYATVSTFYYFCRDTVTSDRWTVRGLQLVWECWRGCLTVVVGRWGLSIRHSLLSSWCRRFCGHAKKNDSENGYIGSCHLSSSSEI